MPPALLVITSLQNERVKRIARLRKGRFRRKLGLFVIDGARELSRAVASGIEIIELFVAANSHELPEERAAALQAASEVAAEVIETTPAVMRKLCFGDLDEGFVAIARTPQRELADFNPPADALLAIIEDVEKPGNIGGILRTADGAGVNGVIVASGGTELYNPNIIRASLGTIFSLPVCAAGPELLLPWLADRGYQIVTTLVDAEKLYTEIDFCPPTAIVLGSEDTGLSSHWRDGESDAGATPNFAPARIPMLGIADSLNVSASAAVLFYEARRQRDAANPAGNGV